jgi:hypothetical protein
MCVFFAAQFMWCTNLKSMLSVHHITMDTIRPACNGELAASMWSFVPLTNRAYVQSRAGAALIYKYPILLDACANEMQRKGDAMMSKWAEVMTNMRPKSYFLRPDVALPLGFAVVREFWNQKIVGRSNDYSKGGSR